jgi:antitoxin component of RelBE/YafQ-DinJ toxin-antitoxin module
MKREYNYEDPTNPRKESVINIRIELDTKEESKKVLYNYGLTHSKFIRYALDYMSETRYIPQQIIEFIERKENITLKKHNK